MNKKKTAPNKRRPRHEAPPVDNHSELEADIAETSDDINTEAQNEGISAEEAVEFVAQEADFDHTSKESAGDEKVRLEFAGSDLIRGRAPKVMELADSVADQWQKDGEFKQVLPVDNELAQAIAQKALRKAKDVEKKLEEKGVFMMARIGLDFAKSKLKRKN